MEEATREACDEGALSFDACAGMGRWRRGSVVWTLTRADIGMLVGRAINCAMARGTVSCAVLVGNQGCDSFRGRWILLCTGTPCGVTQCLYTCTRSLDAGQSGSI